LWFDSPASYRYPRRKGTLRRIEPVTTEIPPEYQQFVQSMIGSGAFPTESAVVAEALRLFQERWLRIADLRKELSLPLESLDRGEGIDLDDTSLATFFEDIRIRGRERLERRKGEK
jgi:putative addiction module CopG family antidote